MTTHSTPLPYEHLAEQDANRTQSASQDIDAHAQRGNLLPGWFSGEDGMLNR